jgi:hypothetical protein
VGGGPPRLPPAGNVAERVHHLDEEQEHQHNLQVLTHSPAPLGPVIDIAWRMPCRHPAGRIVEKGKQSVMNTNPASRKLAYQISF